MRPRMHRTLVVLGAPLVVAALTLLTAQGARAATFIVTRFDDPPPGGCDPNDCSLREAIIAANAAAGADTVSLAGGTYTLSILGTAEDAAANGDLDVTTAPLTITGVGPQATTVDAGGTATGEGAFDVLSELTMFGVTVRGSRATTGAGISVDSMAILSLSDAVVTDNASTGCCSGVTLDGDARGTLTNVTISGNTAGSCCAGVGQGGGITLTLTNVSVIGNSAVGCCVGAITGGDATATFTNVTVSGNSSGSCCAGAGTGGNSVATFTNVTVTGNRAAGSCCTGILFGSGTYSVTNATVADNAADDCCAGFSSGGPTTLNNATITGNRANADNTGADEGGGGIVSGLGIVTIANTIVSGNTVGTGSTGPDCLGTVTSAGYNLVGDTTGCTITGDATGNLIGVDPTLGPVGDHGGFVPTVPLLKGSPAVNAGNPAPPGSGGSACEATDARGLGRNCDIGAYELTFCRKVAVNRIGTPGNDSLRGTSGADGLLGFGGKDALRGKAGKDGLCGGPGKDLLKGGAGKDILDGGPGKDLCVGQAGRDKARSCERTKTIP